MHNNLCIYSPLPGSVNVRHRSKLKVSPRQNLQKLAASKKPLWKQQEQRAQRNWKKKEDKANRDIESKETSARRVKEGRSKRNRERKKKNTHSQTQTHMRYTERLKIAESRERVWYGCVWVWWARLRTWRLNVDITLCCDRSEEVVCLFDINIIILFVRRRNEHVNLVVYVCVCVMMVFRGTIVVAVIIIGCRCCCWDRLKLIANLPQNNVKSACGCYWDICWRARINIFVGRCGIFSFFFLILLFVCTTTMPINGSMA